MAAKRGKRRKRSKMAGRQDGGSGRDRATEAARQQRVDGGRAAVAVAMVCYLSKVIYASVVSVRASPNTVASRA
jgi:hypothetical protein